MYSIKNSKPKKNLKKKFINSDIDNDSNKNKPVKEELLKSFQETQKDLAALTDNYILSNYGRNSQNITDLTTSINLRESIHRLIASYLEYEKGNSKKPNSKLIVCIDDIDLNMNSAYSMIEQIRIYLNTPDLIIFMAIKLNQLANVIKMNYSNFFSATQNDEKSKMQFTGVDDYNEFINKMVERYMSKLLPLSQRIYLPEADNFFQRDVVICHRERNNEIEIKESLSSLQSGLLDLIYRKIRIHFFNSPGQTSYIVPHNLRELRNFIYFLYNLEDAVDCRSSKKNLIFFKQYYHDVWCSNNLDENGRYILNNLQGISNTNTLNYTLLQLLKLRFNFLGNLGHTGYDVSVIDPEIANITASDNVMYNISLGDILACLDWLKNICYEDKDLKLLFAIRTFYTLRLNESYKNKPVGSSIAYSNIVGGNYFNAEYLDVAPYETDQPSRGRRNIDSEILNWILRIFTIQAGHPQGEVSDNEFHPVPQSLSGEDAQLVIEKIRMNDGKIKRITEFFMLTTTFMIDSKENASSNYRKKRSIYYQSSVSRYRKQVCFDVLSIFYNLINLTRTYTRYENYDPSVLDWHRQQEKTKSPSLYQLIYAQEADLQDIVSLRNIEILEQISCHLQRNRQDASCNHFMVLKGVFDNLLKYEFTTTEGDRLKFKCFSPISQLLDEVYNDSDPVYVKVFNAIYNNGK